MACTLDLWVVNNGRSAVKVPSVGNHVNPNGSGEVYEPSGDIPGEMMDIMAVPPLEGGQEMHLSVVIGDLDECREEWGTDEE